jgi:hypothetical protein
MLGQRDGERNWPMVDGTFTPARGLTMDMEVR